VTPVLVLGVRDIAALTLALSRRERGLTEVSFELHRPEISKVNVDRNNTINWLPFPSPREGEGTDRGVLSSYIDLEYRVELRF
jgi:hypothetical protein